MRSSAPCSFHLIISTEMDLQQYILNLHLVLPGLLSTPLNRCLIRLFNQSSAIDFGAVSSLLLLEVVLQKIPHSSLYLFAIMSLDRLRILIVTAGSEGFNFATYCHPPPIKVIPFCIPTHQV